MNHYINISVVIPTIGRGSVLQSLESVFNQSYKVKDVIVCYDGDDYLAFSGMISEFISKKNSSVAVSVINVGPFSGGNVARQKGIEISTSDYIALLDDDDVWLNNHISDYVEIIKNSKFPVLFSCFASVVEEKTGALMFDLPSRGIMHNESIPDYLFKVRKINLDCGFIQSSLMMFSRELALKVPFDVDLKYHQDIDWLLRLSQSNIDFKFIQTKNNTVTYNSTPLSVSKRINSIQSMQWARKVFHDKRCLGDFILTQSYNYARDNENFKAELKVLITSLIYSSPGIYALIRFFIKLLRIDKIIK